MSEYHDGASREMSLTEFVNSLYAGHRAVNEYANLLADRKALVRFAQAFIEDTDQFTRVDLNKVADALEALPQELRNEINEP